MSRKRTTLAGAVAALLVAMAVAVPTLAQKVDNPGGVTFTFVSGSLKVGSQETSTDSSDPITFAGSVAANGAVTIPKANIVFPPQETDGPLGTVTVNITPLGDATGSLDPLTGAASLNASVKITASGSGLGSCHIDPINLHLSTATDGGVPYNDTTGTVTLADRTFSVPGAQDCGPFGSLNGTVNGQLGLPSGSGNNFGVLTANVTPIIHKAVTASLSATPASGFTPLAVDFDASASHVRKGPASYRWDFDGNGTTDQTTSTSTVTHTYASQGTFGARVTVVDADGDSATAAKTITATTRTPDVSITKTHAGSFLASSDGVYTLTVHNGGTTATTGTTTVTDVLPDSLTYGSATGLGWTCGAAAQVVTCSTDDPIAVGANAPPITLTVGVTGDAVPTVTNTASVTTPGDVNHANDSGSDTAAVIRPQPDLTIDKSHEGGYFLRSGPANPRGTYDLQVHNAGGQPTSGPITVTDVLPTGLTFHSAFGSGWSCGNAGQAVTCTTDAVVAGGADAELIRIVTDVATDAPDSIVNTATVSTPADADATNDSDTDTVATRPFGVDLAIDKSHDGTLVRGEEARYRLAVTNNGTEGSAGPVVVTDPLPDGLTYLSAAGAGWSCDAPSGTVTCTRTAALDAGATAPGITLRTMVGAAAADGVTNTASVSGPETDLNPSDNQDADPANIRSLQPDLAIDKSHSGTFMAGRPATFSLAVSNPGSDPTYGMTTVTDHLPASLTFDSVSGDGWACGHTGQDVTCTRTDPIAAGASAPTIAVRVVPTLAAAPSVSNSASVSTPGDGNAANDSDTDTADVSTPAAATGLVDTVKGTVTYPGFHGSVSTFTIDVTRTNILGGDVWNGKISWDDPGLNYHYQGTINAFTPVFRAGINGARGNAGGGNGPAKWAVDDLSAIGLGADTIAFTDQHGYVFSGPITGGDITVTGR